MLTRQDLEVLAEQRLQDALLLLREGRASSAYYLAGYALELGLKACIARSFQSDTIPEKSFVLEVYTHDLARLLVSAGLDARLDADSEADPKLADAWTIARSWSEASRYVIWDTVAASKLVAAINDPDHGVFPWLKSHWSKVRSSKPLSS